MSLLVSKTLLVGAILAIFAAQAMGDTAPAGKKTAASASASASSRHPASKSKFSKARSRRSKKGAWKRHGQQEIQPERASAIQQALIREKYLTGEPNGQWDARTQAAMARYQTDHGWQSKVTPDSRALIKLGLGPDYSDKNMMLFVPKPAADPVAVGAPRCRAQQTTVSKIW